MKKYIISENKLKELLERDNELATLEANGVDNWSGYGESYDDDFDEDEEEFSMEDFIKDNFEEYIEPIDEVQNMIDSVINEFNADIETSGHPSIECSYIKVEYLMDDFGSDDVAKICEGVESEMNRILEEIELINAYEVVYDGDYVFISKK